ncbi:RelA/SpoT family protein [Chitinimonas sp. BJB300]|uniref:RelA/SpoT family protein n=1 Tax=Chitinimonas sp. BJB300 TaxID=1559339 RepID=UPI000C11E823|nr:bifunctional (p)ppGpp synthetase/guanosine-3',5'-bis(diphosphate) 3'-pyrophosphohydrolase [Chitinimonas sp. BJB300]PHV12167.1 GTP pyrophosphokinase [Chitinimonas sp. BJB300]TSJ90101.1 bifunctional (p)ppGpp synthetase/guanosine-3',5'-bis(diphosphate) 3'-pyrophosphohydrolase [Chitinimonas sp. BJB300]
MVAPTRPLAVSVAEAADPQAWLSRLTDRYTPEEMSQLAIAMEWAQTLYAGRCYSPIDAPVFPHAVAAASIVADLRLSADTVIASLLFCAPDYLPDAYEQIGARFGETVAKLVDGISKVRKMAALSRIEASRKEDAQQQIETVRKMLLAMVEDIRVVLVKLAWRTQTMHYLAKCDEAVRVPIARETLDIFAPLANRLGVWQIKWELEDLGFRHLEPVTYKKIASLLDEKRVDRENFIAESIAFMRDELLKQGIKADLMGRPKHIFSIYKKMKKKRLDFSEMYDIRAIRVLVNSIPECYTALGVVHNLWQPIPGEFDDYISKPKGNFYRSLHTVVMGPNDKALEVQIRTFDMHEHAEYGVAAHWRYKEGGQGDTRYEEKIAWLRQLLDWRDDMSQQNTGQSDSSSADNFGTWRHTAALAEAFQAEQFDDSIYALTPAGRVIVLPHGSTPVDFAYHLHTDLGHRCRGAKVDGHIVPLDTALQTGQRVEIIAAKEGGPSLDWLHQGYLKSHRAVTKVRHWVRQQNLDVAIEAGRTILDREVGRTGTHPNLEELADKLGFKHLNELLAAVGQNEVTARDLALALAPAPVATLVEAENIVKRARADTHGEGILIEGVDKLMTMLAKCCKPVPPDAVIGFVTKGRGISIHRRDCATLKRLSANAPERLITADWGNKLSCPQQSQVFSADIAVEAHDRPSLLRDISDLFSRDKINVTAAQTLTRNQFARMRFTLEIRDAQTLRRVMDNVQTIPGVISVIRR